MTAQDLQPGGKAAAYRQSVLGLGVTATMMTQLGNPSQTAAAVPYNQITVMNQPLGNDNNLFVVERDGVRVAMPVQVAGAPSFTDNVIPTKYIPVITANGVALDPNTANSNAVFSVGQQVTFSYSWSPNLPPSVQTCNSTWALGGNFVSASNQPPTGSPIYTNDPTLLTNQTVSAWWTSGGTNSTGTVYTVTLTNILTFANGNPPQTNMAQGRFAMLRPTLTNYAARSPGIGVFLVTNAIKMFTNGIWQTNIVSVPFLLCRPAALFGTWISSQKFDGVAGVTQLISGKETNASFSEIISGTNLDGSEFYSNRNYGAMLPVLAGIAVGPPMTSNNLAALIDDPGIPCVGSTGVNLNFTDYVRFKPNAGNPDNNLFVTLGTVSWHVYGSANTNSSNPTNYTIIGTTSTSIDPTPSSSDGFPIWKNITTNSQWWLIR